MEFDSKTSSLDRTKLAEFKAPVDKRSACFIVIAGTQAGRMYKLDDVELLIGRVFEAGIQVEDNGVSRRHARIVRQADGSVAVEDLGSTNGTFCNGQKVQALHVLQDGDKIQIGTTTILKFSLQDNLEEDFQRQQYESATRDALTVCYNKKYFLERMPGDFAFAKRHRNPLSLAMVDLDHFKRVNDTYGHQAGDYVLRLAAKVMQDCIRADDVLVRYGGEEFAVIMRETNAEAAIVAAERIRRRVESTAFIFEEKRIAVTVSIGIGTYNGGSPDTPEALLQLADGFLYKAKNGGRNRTEAEYLVPLPK